ncbi:MAG: hypothetical protein H7175_25130 [Burkholderiales bacterium]|nr:hypothetical protein [Anaerolineae bacterium]
MQRGQPNQPPRPARAQTGPLGGASSSSGGGRTVYRTPRINRLPLLILAFMMVALGIGALVVPLLAALQDGDHVNVGLFLIMPLAAIFILTAYWIYQWAERRRLRYLFLTPTSIELRNGNDVISTSWDNVERIGFVRGGPIGRHRVSFVLVNPPQYKGNPKGRPKAPYHIPLDSFLPLFAPLQESGLGRDIRAREPHLFQQRWSQVN